MTVTTLHPQRQACLLAPAGAALSEQCSLSTAALGQGWDGGASAASSEAAAAAGQRAARLVLLDGQPLGEEARKPRAAVPGLSLPREKN